MSIEPDEVHVWRLNLTWPPAQVAALQALLDGGEQARASRFHFARDRDRFIAAHAQLRQILAHTVGLPPAAVRLAAHAGGKPYLDRPTGSAQDVCFNLSHSGQQALLALTLGREVGVDIEQVRADVEVEAIAERFFAPGEVRRLLALAVEDRREAFFRCWTRKEAYLKARGDGLATPLGGFEVTLEPGEPPRLLHVADDADEPGRWRFYDVATPPGYVGVVAVSGGKCRLTASEWSPAGA